MMQRLTQFIITRAAMRWPVVLALVAQLSSFRLLRLLGARFARHTGGHEPFDFQHGLTVAAIQAQLPAYSAESRRLYRQFFVADLFFPLIGSSFLALLWATILRQWSPARQRQLLRWNAALWPFIATLCDWGENVCFLVLIERHPRRTPLVAPLGVTMKRLKLGSLLATMATTALLVLAEAARRVGAAGAR